VVVGGATSRLILLPVTACIVVSAAIYIMVVIFKNTICLPPPQLSLHRRAALSSNSNGTRSVYRRKNPKSSLYCEMSMIDSRGEISMVTILRASNLSGKSFFLLLVDNFILDCVELAEPIIWW
jgi:hypothetical protein